MYYTYMVRCIDDSIYTGIAKDINKRMKEHYYRDKKCAKYTLSHPVKLLEVVFESMDKSSASKLEYYLKTLTKYKKENIILNASNINRLLPESLQVYEYRMQEEYYNVLLEELCK